MVDPLLGEAEARAVYDVVLSGWLSAGPNGPALERAFAQLSNTEHAVAFCNGTVALQAMLVALGVGPGDEVIVPDITFISTATSVLHAGATPVFADVLPGTLTIDPASAATLMTPRTKAVMPVHYAGQAADMDELLALGAAHGVAVVEDAAQAHGMAYRGRKVGSLGRAAMFSFTPNKNITMGEGGIVTTNDGDLAHRLRRLRNHGSTDLDLFEIVGYNFRLTEMQAALGLAQLVRLPGILERKRRIATTYRAAIAELAGLEALDEADDRTQAFQLFTVRVDKSCKASRSTVAEVLTHAGVQTSVYFPPLHKQPIFRGIAREVATLPVSARLGDEILSLPIHAKLTDAEIATVTGALAKALD